MQIQLRHYDFTIDPGQNTDMWTYINTGRWEPHSFDIFDYFVPKNGSVMDIGAWSGVLSLYIANKARKVYAIDPDPVCFQELTRNIKLNACLAKKIKAYAVAISNKKGDAQLSARETYGKSSSSILNRKRDTEQSTVVTTLSLLDFIEQEQIRDIDLIKMDVEGAEFLILPKIKKALAHLNYPTLYVSFHYGFLKEHIYHHYINSRILTKLALKIEEKTGLSLFRKKIQNTNKNLFIDLLDYNYIYTSKGELVTKSQLANPMLLIKNNDLVFTNIKWQ